MAERIDETERPVVGIDLGLVSRRKQSGVHDPEMRFTKAGESAIEQASDWVGSGQTAGSTA